MFQHFGPGSAGLMVYGYIKGHELLCSITLFVLVPPIGALCVNEFNLVRFIFAPNAII